MGENIDGQLGTSASIAETPVKVGNIPINISSVISASFLMEN